MTGRLAILCSGQGGQHRDMFRLFETEPEAAPIFAAAARHLNGTDPRVFVTTAAEPDLFANHAGQILCCTQALAACATLVHAFTPEVILAGYSVGELAAWGCAGLFDPVQTIDLAAARAAAMDRAAPAHAGLAAIVGLPRARLDALLPEGTAVAIVNGPDSVVIGGPDAALDALLVLAARQGATRTVHLRVAVPSHTPALAAASAEFARILANVSLRRQRPGTRLLGSLDAETVRNPQRGLAALAAQISTTIEWSQCLQAAREAGAARFLELGPGTALRRMAGQSARAIDEFRTVSGIRDWLARP
jgi:[acyl-carrier-protein] S-malonyltransferase